MKELLAWWKRARVTFFQWPSEYSLFRWGEMKRKVVYQLLVLDMKCPFYVSSSQAFNYKSKSLFPDGGKNTHFLYNFWFAFVYRNWKDDKKANILWDRLLMAGRKAFLRYSLRAGGLLCREPTTSHVSQLLKKPVGFRWSISTLWMWAFLLYFLQGLAREILLNYRKKVHVE